MGGPSREIGIGAQQEGAYRDQADTQGYSPLPTRWGVTAQGPVPEVTPTGKPGLSPLVQHLTREGPMWGSVHPAAAESC